MKEINFNNLDKSESQKVKKGVFSKKEECEEIICSFQNLPQVSIYQKLYSTKLTY